MEAKLARLTYKIAIQLHLMAESCTICSSRSGRPVWKLLDTHSYVVTCECSDVLYWTDWQIHGNTWDTYDWATLRILLWQGMYLKRGTTSISVASPSWTSHRIYVPCDYGGYWNQAPPQEQGFTLSWSW